MSITAAQKSFAIFDVVFGEDTDHGWKRLRKRLHQFNKVFNVSIIAAQKVFTVFDMEFGED